MLTREENEALTRVGPDTPAGKMFRRYWHPIALSSQLPHPDCDPLRESLLGERFVVFRDSAGKVGVLDELCCHRGASLALGRVEEGGIRCLYHGWKFAVDGTILETPNHADPRFRQKIKAPAYPAREQSGMIWTYIGPAAEEPPFRRWAFDLVPEEERVVCRINVKANYLQLWEGGADSSHVGILHANQIRPDWKAKQGVKADDGLGRFVMTDHAPEFEIEDTPFGFHYAAMRAPPQQGNDPTTRNVRVVPIIMPSMRFIPNTHYTTVAIETPASDGATSTFLIAYSTTNRAMDRKTFEHLWGLDDERFYSRTTCEFTQTWDTRFGQDRVGMSDSWSGFHGIEIEDAAMSLSNAPVANRTKEHLVTADQAIVRLRRRIMDSIQMNDIGKPPLGVMVEDMTRVGGFHRDLNGSDDRWQHLARAHTELEPAE